MGFIDYDPYGLEVPETWNYVQNEDHFSPEIVRLEEGSVIRSA